MVMLGCSVLRFTWCGVDTDALQVVASFLQVFRSSVYMGQPISVRRTCQPSTERGTFKFNWSGAPNILVISETCSPAHMVICKNVVYH